MKGRLALAGVLFVSACATNPEPAPAPLARDRKLLSRDLMEQFTRDLSASDPAIQAEAIWALSRSSAITPEALELIGPLAESDQPAVAEAATWAVKRFKSSRDAEILDPKASSETPPSLLRQTKPIYPTEAFNRKLQGVVVMSILISAEGKVVHAEIDHGVVEFNEAAVACVRQWLFRPGTRNGRPIPFFATAPVSFRYH